MNAQEIQAWLVAQISELLQLEPQELDVHTPFDSYGLSSTEAVVLSGELAERLGRELPATLVYEHPTIAELADHLGNDGPRSGNRTEPHNRQVDSSAPIAVIGISCRFPGAPDPPSYWRMLRDGSDKIREVPGDRWNADAWYHPDATVPGKSITRWGGFLDRVDLFDPFFFGISPGEAERMDPQQRLLLELAYESVEDAGYPMAHFAGSNTGVFVGVSVNEYSFLQHGNPELLDSHSGTGSALSIAANRISYFFDLHGPSMAVDTACSSSLMAVHLACRSLRAGESEVALAGGANVVLSPAHSVAFTKAGLLAPDGRCKVFDAAADGYVRGEGGGLVVLKPLARALTDGDEIHAVIRGTAVQQDGRTNGLVAPSREAQEAVLRAAYRDAGVPPAQVQYVEAHGTGTLLGDSIEARALGEVVGRDRANGPCVLGSVKSNFGHLEAAAGIAGLIKVILSLRQQAIPPSLHYTTPNPHVRFADLGLRVQGALTPWPDHTGPALAGVSSFGFGGTNVHAVIEQAPQSNTARSDEPPADTRVDLLPLSAHTPQALDAVVAAHRGLLAPQFANETTSLHDACVAVTRRQNHFDHRVAFVATSTHHLLEEFDSFLDRADAPSVVSGRGARGDPGKLAFVFSGQGSQWYRMGRELLQEEPVVRESLERCDRALRPHCDWALLEQLEADKHQSRLGEIDVIQPTLFALQVALADLWRSWGIEPDAVVGHSMGEVAAAYVAGALGLDDAARVICARSNLLKRLTGRGGMAVVGLSADETGRLLADRNGRLAIAARNSPNSTVVSGDIASLTEFVAAVEERDDVYCSMIKVDVASHSPQTAPLGEELERALESVHPTMASVPFISTVTGTRWDGLLDAAYWARNITAPVNFTGAMADLLDTDFSGFVEISPHPVLQSSMQQLLIHRETTGVVLSSTRREEPERYNLLLSLAALYASGRSINWQGVHPRAGRRVSLPTYPWQRQRYWIDPPATKVTRSDQPTHPLLGERVSLANSPGSSVWQTEIDLDTVSFHRDHRVNDQTVLPASALIDLAMSTARPGLGARHDVRDLDIRTPLALTANERRTIQVVQEVEEQGDISVRIYSRATGDAEATWTLHASGRIGDEHGDADSAIHDIAKIQHDCAERISGDQLYAGLATRGLDYGPTLRGVEHVWRRDGEALGRVSLPEWLRHETDLYQIHPALLDACFHVLAAAAPSMNEQPAAPASYVPVGCRRAMVYREPAHTVWSHVVLQSDADTAASEIEGSVEVLDDSGNLVAEFTGLRLARITVDHPRPAMAESDTWVYGIRWQPAPWPTIEVEWLAEDGCQWLILADRHGIAEALKDLLKAHDQTCVLLSYDEALTSFVDGPEDVERRDSNIRNAIAEQLAAVPSRLRGVLDLWSIDVGRGTDASPTSLRAASHVTCTAAVHLVQGLAERGGRLGTPRLWIVTQGAQRVLPDELVSPPQAPVWGLGRTIGFELPAFRCTMVDLDPSLEPMATAQALFRQLFVDDAEDQVALRAEHRFVPRLVPATHPGSATCEVNQTEPVRADGTYLITGGFGGLGLAVANWFVEQGAQHVGLVGRTVPSAQATAAIERMRQKGADITIVTADVAMESQLDAALTAVRRGNPPLRGVVHAAGVLDNAPIVSLDAEQLARVMAPKVEGAWNVHAATTDDPLDFFVLFSSAVSILGSPGQGNYAAANSFLDALAHHRRQLGLPGISINWGPWAEIGLVASGDFTPAVGNSESHGVKGITPAHGLEMFGRALRDDRAQLTVLPFDLANLLELYPTAAQIPFFAEVVGKDTHVARLYSRPDLQQAYVAPRNEIERQLAELWRRALRIDRVGIRDSFFELGGDSVLAAQIVTSAHKRFGVSIDLRDAFQAFTIERLAQVVESALLASIDELSESEALRLLAE